MDATHWGKYFGVLFFVNAYRKRLLWRKSKALLDNLYPSCIIVGYPKLIDNPEFKEENDAIKAIS